MNKIIISLVLLASLGLAIIQANFVRIGFQLEQGRFDQKISQTLIDVREHLEQHNELSYLLLDLFQEPQNFFIVPQDSLVDRTQEVVDIYLKKRLLKNGIDVPVEYAITGPNNKPVYLTTEILSEQKMAYGKYFSSLGRRIEKSCDCRLFLHLYSTEFNSYVLNQLAYLIFPSVLCILTIIVCLGLLIYTLGKQRKLHEVKNDFINNLTHELKTPVFSISVANKMLRQKIDSGKLENSEKLLDAIDKENEHLKIHINRVLELASLENDNQHLHKEKTDILQLIETVIADNKLKVESRKGRIEFKYNGYQPDLKLDKNHFKNVLQNLLDNAMYYCQDSPVISIETAKTEKAFIIKVKDNGVGIAPNHQKNIFDKFYRVPTGDLHQVKGFGLGLSYVKQIVEAHGGTVSLESTLGQGSTFIISLPEKRI